MKAQAVVTAAFGDLYREIAHHTHPSLKTYADRIGADFLVLNKRKYPDVSCCYEKLQVTDLLRRYKRICWIDTDAIVRSTTPNLFEVVPLGKFGIVDEGHYPASANIWNPEKIALQYQPYGYTPKIEHNGGVMVFSYLHRNVFENPLILNTPYYDQPMINIQLEKLKIDILELPREYNYSPLHAVPDPDLYKRIHILHYAGDLSRKLPAIKKELNIS